MIGHRKDNNNIRNILVVGGAGYIGSHMAKVLEKEGYNPVILDDLSTGYRSAARNLPFYESKASNTAVVTEVIQKHQIHAVMHFGASASVAESVKNPLLYFENNVTETIWLLKTILACGVKNFVFSSTCAVFGEPQKLPLSENHPKNPINPYGLSKLMVENVLETLCKTEGLNAAVLRYFNAAGADPEGELGENHEPETHLIPLVIEAAMGVSTRYKSLTVFGKDYPTKDGTCIRDYIHINDLASGHILAMNHIATHGGFVDFNLGTGDGYTNLEVIHTVDKITGLSTPFIYGDRRSGDPAVLVADSTKAGTVLGWKPKYKLDSMVQTAHKWLLKKHGK